MDAAPERRRVPLVRRHHIDLCRTSTAICSR
ncbi:putative leader peptide [Pseudonocardia aurantiaca]|uniref:Leader peptide n=1 Tax=Pseudonocardia aurantiaca TaxID=75290 RepID=A0ABW4FKG9_9PSEU